MPRRPDDSASDGGEPIASDLPADGPAAGDAIPLTWAETERDVDEAEPEAEPEEAVEQDVPLDPGEALTARRRRALAQARRNGLPPRLETWRKRTATGAVLTGFALGFQEALGTEQQKPAIIMEASGDPPTDLPVDAEVDQIRPADNVVRIRPWLLGEGEDGEEVPADDNPGPS